MIQRFAFRTGVIYALGLVFLVTASPKVFALTVTVENAFHFRSYMSVNSAGLNSGSTHRIGVVSAVPNGAMGTFGGARPPGSTCTEPSCLMPLSFDPFLDGPGAQPNRFARAPTFNPDWTGSWDLFFQNCTDKTPGPDMQACLNGVGASGPFSTPSIEGVAEMPIPINVMVSGDAATPTISWEIPEQEVANRGLNVDYVNILIRDLGTLQDAGTSVAKAVYNVGVVDPATTSFTMPAGALDLNGYYSVQLTLNDTRDGSRRIEQVQSAGTGIFNFVPDVVNQTGGQGVFTPFVDLSGPTTVYHFNGTVVEKEIMFIDPLFAVGYDYAIGVGDPNFASVLLPMVGDNLFELWLWDGLDYVLEDILTAGVEYFFEPAGVDRFRILGIETSAMLDPTNAAAFVTGLTFNASGTFTGTMTPITQFVPAPATLALLLVGLTSIGHRVRKRGFGCVSS